MAAREGSTFSHSPALALPAPSKSLRRFSPERATVGLSPPFPLPPPPSSHFLERHPERIWLATALMCHRESRSQRIFSGIPLTLKKLPSGPVAGSISWRDLSCENLSENPMNVGKKGQSVGGGLGDGMGGGEWVGEWEAT